MFIPRDEVALLPLKQEGKESYSAHSPQLRLSSSSFPDHREKGQSYHETRS